MDDEQRQLDFEAIAEMISRAGDRGLLVEVIYFAMSDPTKDLEVSEKCMDALNEWDC